MSLDWRVINVIRELDDGRQRERDVTRIRKIILHRVGTSLGHTGPEIAKRFLHDPQVAKYTGGQNPYTFYVGYQYGRIWQALPVDEVGNHARRWNVEGLGIALIGDFRTEAPRADTTWGASLVLVSHLCEALGLSADDVEPHTGGSLQGTTASSAKDCPGRMFNMDRFREEVRIRMLNVAKCGAHGIVWDGI